MLPKNRIATLLDPARFTEAENYIRLGDARIVVRARDFNFTPTLERYGKSGRTYVLIEKDENDFFSLFQITDGPECFLHLGSLPREKAHGLSAWLERKIL